MTLTVALTARDGIVMATDSRGTVGDPRGLTAISDDAVKLFGLGACGLTTAGASELGAALLDELQKAGLGQFPDIDLAAAQIRPKCAALYQEWFGQIPPKERPAVMFTLAGYRSPRSAAPRPLTYMLVSPNNFAPMLFESKPCLAGVPQYAVYLVHRYYDATIDLERAKSLAEYLITETASQDPKVGGPVQMATITPSSGFSSLTPEAVRSIHDGNDRLNSRLRVFFKEGGDGDA